MVLGKPEGRHVSNSVQWDIEIMREFVKFLRKLREERPDFVGIV